MRLRIALAAVALTLVLGLTSCEQATVLLRENPAIVQHDEQAAAHLLSVEGRIAALEALPARTSEQEAELAALRQALVVVREHRAEAAELRRQALKELEAFHGGAGDAGASALRQDWIGAIIALLGTAAAAITYTKRDYTKRVQELDQRQRAEREAEFTQLAGVLNAQGLVGSPYARSAEAAQSPVAQATRTASSLALEREVDALLARRLAPTTPRDAGEASQRAGMDTQGMRLGGPSLDPLLFRGLSGGAGVPHN